MADMPAEIKVMVGEGYIRLKQEADLAYQRLEEEKSQAYEIAKEKWDRRTREWKQRLPEQLVAYAHLEEDASEALNGPMSTPPRWPLTGTRDLVKLAIPGLSKMTVQFYNNACVYRWYEPFVRGADLANQVDRYYDEDTVDSLQEWISVEWTQCEKITDDVQIALANARAMHNLAEKLGLEVKELREQLVENWEAYSANLDEELPFDDFLVDSSPSKEECLQRIAAALEGIWAHLEETRTA